MKNNINIRNLFGLIVLMVVSVAVSGQDVGSSIIVINSGFTPEIKDAKKISHKPELPDTNYTAPEFSYSIVSSRIHVPFQPRPIGAAKMEGEKLDKIYKGYVAVGFGNYASPYLDLRYSLGRSRDMKAGVAIQHFSSAGEIKDYIFPGVSDNQVGGYFTKLWKKNYFTATGSYHRNMVHYYGVNKLDTALTNGEDLTDATNEHLFNRFNVNLDFGRHNLKRSKTNFNTAIGYKYILDNYESRENALDIEAFIDRDVNFFKAKQQKLGIAAGFQFFNNSDSVSFNNAYILDLKPYYYFKTEKVDLQIGFKMNVADDSLTEVFFYPDLNINFRVIEDILSFNFLMSGGAYKQNYNDLTAENPFVNALLPMQISNNQFKSKLTMISSISRNIDFQLSLDYENWKNGAFFVVDTTIALRNKFSLVYDDYDLINLGAQVAAHFNEKLDVIFKADYYAYNLKNELFAWHKPDYKLSLLGHYRIADKIRVNADITYFGPMKSLDYENNVRTSKDIDAWFDLSLGVEYRYKKRIGFFVNFNNIAASRYQKWYNYPSYGFNFLAGASYLF